METWYQKRTAMTSLAQRCYTFYWQRLAGCGKIFLMIVDYATAFPIQLCYALSEKGLMQIYDTVLCSSKDEANVTNGHLYPSLQNE